MQLILCVQHGGCDLWLWYDRADYASHFIKTVIVDLRDETLTVTLELACDMGTCALRFSSAVPPFEVETLACAVVLVNLVFFCGIVPCPKKHVLRLGTCLDKLN